MFLNTLNNEVTNVGGVVNPQAVTFIIKIASFLPFQRSLVIPKKYFAQTHQFSTKTTQLRTHYGPITDHEKIIQIFSYKSTRCKNTLRKIPPNVGIDQ